MSLVYLLTSLDGRINRAKYWIGAIAVTAASILGTALAVAAFGMSNLSVTVTVLIALALLYPTYALMAKRFQDRDKPGWTALCSCLSTASISCRPSARSGGPSPGCSLPCSTWSWWARACGFSLSSAS